MQIVIDIPDNKIKLIKDCIMFNNLIDIDIYDTVLDAIKNGTPIPKGRWIHRDPNVEQDEPDFMLWECSNCGFVIFSETEKDRLEFHRFCSRCGAKMEADKEAEGDRKRD